MPLQLWSFVVSARGWDNLHPEREKGDWLSETFDQNPNTGVAQSALKSARETDQAIFWDIDPNAKPYFFRNTSRLPSGKLRLGGIGSSARPKSRS